MLGILGGMGPLATLDFMAKVISATDAARDQDHVPMIVSSVPQVPDRTDAIMHNGEDPLPEMLRGICTLERAGASVIAIPCNTAHYWYPQLASFARVPILNIVDATIQEIEQRERRPTRIGILATQGTLAAGIYQNRLEGFDVVVPQNVEQVMAGITRVKGGGIGEGTELLEAAAARMLDAGCDVILMACTEIPVALAAVARQMPHVFIDPTEALARACVRKWRGEDHAHSLLPSAAPAASCAHPA